MSLPRVNILIASSDIDAEWIQHYYPQYKNHLPVTPKTLPSCILVGEYLWTPRALQLPARVRLAIRGALSSLLDEGSIEETFPDTLLSW